MKKYKCDLHPRKIYFSVLKGWILKAVEVLGPTGQFKDLAVLGSRVLDQSFSKSDKSTIGLRSETPLGRQVLNSLSESKSFPRESLILFESDLISDAFETNPDERTCEENFHNHSKC